ncbi:MAG: TIGR01777 family protein [Tetrasphaera sp.]|nr:TIGR01777 family protein [Tetrasphaera sp.]
MDTPQRVLVAGSTGLIGTALCRALRDRGDEVVRLVRGSPGRGDELGWDPVSGTLPTGSLDGVHAVVNLAGAGVGDHRWTPDYKRTVLASRVDTTRTLAEAIASAGRPVRFVAGSAVGYYGDRGEEALDETSERGEGFLADVVLAWESAADAARQAGAPVVHARTGIVLSRSGGALARLLPLVRLALAGPIGSGRQFWPWITLVDEVRALIHLIDRPDMVGPVNLVGPAPARQREVVAALASAAGRPALLPAPALALRLVLGEFADDILGSQRVIGTALVDSGFTHVHPTVEQAAAWVLEGETPA